MKKAGMLSLLLLCLFGCSRTPDELQRGIALRSSLLNASVCRFDADITADYTDEVHRFSVQCECDAQGTLRFAVAAPESISGIRGTVDGEGGTLAFEDVALCFDLLTDDQISPVSAPWLLMKALRSGYLRAAGLEDGLIHLTIDDSYEEDALQVDVFLDSADLPKRAEFLYDGRRIVSMDLRNVEIM